MESKIDSWLPSENFSLQLGSSEIMQCPSCGSRDIDYHEAGGHSACVKCGTVVEENVIVSSIEFQVSQER